MRRYTRKYRLDKADVKASVIMERPMINAERFKQSKNAARAFEATLVVLEMLGLKDNYIIIDSKKWQHYFFGKDTVNLDLKEESQKEGIRYLTSLGGKRHSGLCDLIRAHGDADSLLISRYALEKLV